ncbi:SURF1 family protein [Spartinivicinus ruber]|uniref:SURF1 family protein n=1 Tax=Spartinivicinus ruber TaxID=2683272 RepID=UPI0013D553B9|nr:SURF1 family protein [Spartinivicinus ruber]
MKLLLNNIVKHYQLSILVLIVITTTTVLGIWQISRGYEKVTLQEKFIQKSSGEPVDLDQFLSSTENKNNRDDINYRYVISKGSFIRNQHILLDNQIVNGRVGFNVISPFVTEQGRLVLVDRGWIGPITRRDQLPEVPEYNEQLKLVGILFNQLSKPFLLSKEALASDWPKIVQALDTKQLKKIFNLTNFYLIRLDKPQEGAFTPHYKLINISPEKHWGYAVQWFAMAVIILLLFLRFIYKNK